MNDNLEKLTYWVSQHKSTTLPAYLKRNEILRAWLHEQTKSYTVSNDMERVYILLKQAQPICLCGNPCKFNTFEKGYRTGCYLGNKCLSVVQERVTKQRDTLQRKYGVDSVSLIPGITEKKKLNNIEKYGVDHHTKTDHYKSNVSLRARTRTHEQKQSSIEKSKSTSKEKYGVEHHMKSTAQREKLRKTNQLRYGVDVPLQNHEIKQKLVKTINNRSSEYKEKVELKRKQTLIEIYGVDAASRIHISEHVLDILDHEETFKNYITDKTRAQVLQSLGIAAHTLYLYARKYNVSELFSRPTASVLESELSEFLDLLQVKYTRNNRSIIKPLELDFYLEEYGVAIEIGSLYWHSEISGNRDKNYHWHKHLACEQLGIQLITIFDDEWYVNSDIVKSKLAHILNKTSEKYQARKCKVVQITVEQTKNFLEKYHLQGYTHSNVNIALETDLGDIVAVMTFARARYNKKYQYEMIRFCSKGCVTGAAGKLFNYFIKNYNPLSVISYSDNRWSTGAVYTQLGFKKEVTTLGYHYTDYKKRYRREKFQKHKLVQSGADKNLTEWQIMQQQGYDRIWDCGQTLWSYTK